MISPEDSINQKRLSLSQLSQQVREQAAESSSDEDELLTEKPASTFGSPSNRQARTANVSKDIEHQNSRADVDPMANLDAAFLNNTGEETLGEYPGTVSPDVSQVSNDPRTDLKQEEADAQSTMDSVSTKGKNSNESAGEADDISVISIHDSSSESEDNDYPGNLQAQIIVTQTQASIKRDAGSFWDDCNSEEEESDDEVEDSVPPPPPAKPSTDDEDSDATREVEKNEEKIEYAYNNLQHSPEQQDTITDQTSVQQTSKAPLKKEKWTERKNKNIRKSSHVLVLVGCKWSSEQALVLQAILGRQRDSSRIRKQKGHLQKWFSPLNHSQNKKTQASEMLQALR
jgi:hypothetical protein